MADKNVAKQKRLRRRRYSVRNKLFGTAERPRLSVYRSEKHIYAQVIDDMKGHTVVTASSLEKDVLGDAKSGANVDVAKKVGAVIAQRAKDAGVEKVQFDRNGRRYHGRVKALADAARDGGLNF